MKETINFVGLGGFAEVGCKMFLLEIDKEIYIFDAGMKYPEDAIYGIDKIIPDLTYVKNNSQKVKGIFISNVSDDNIGALSMLMKFVKAPIFGSEFSISVLKKEVQKKGQEFNVLNPGEEVKVGSITVTPVALTYSLPGNNAYLVETKYGNIVHVSDFVFNQNVPNAYDTDFSEITALNSKNVVAMTVPVQGAETNSFGRTNVDFNKQMTKAISEAQAGVFVNVFTKNFLAIQTVINIALKTNKQVCIIGKKGYELLQSAIKSKVISVPRSTLVHVKKVSKENHKNVIFLVLGDEGVPYELMLHILSDTHRDIRMHRDDIAVIAVPKVPGSELKVSAVVDALFKKNLETIEIKPENVSFDVAGSEDMKMLYNMIKPNYVIPIDGEYRQMIEFQNKMTEFGLSEDAIVFADNGEWLGFSDGKHVKTKRTDLSLDTILVDGKMAEDSDNIVLQEREQLSTDGVVVLTVAILEKNQKYTVQYVNFDSLGFIPRDDQKDLIVEIHGVVSQTVEKMNKEETIRLNDMKKKIQEAINQTIYRKIKRYPISVIQFVIQ